MKIEAGQTNKGIDNGKNKSHVRAFLFIIKNEYASQVIGKMSSGDLLYCK